MVEQSIKHALLGFNVGNVEWVSTLSGGIENNNYLVECTDAKYVLRVYNESHSIRGFRTLKSIQDELSFVMACKGTIPIATPLPNAQGSLVSKVSDAGYCALFVYVSGSSPKIIDAGIVKEYAKVLDALYEVSNRFETAHRALEYDIVSRSLAKAASCNIDMPEVRSLISRIRNKLSSENLAIQKLSTGMVHGDIKLANTLFDGDKLTALLDFDDCRYSYLLEDTVMTIAHNIDQPNLNLLRAGYLDTLISSITNVKLLQDIHSSLRTLLQARLMYDICKYAEKDVVKLEEIMNDKSVEEILS